MALFGLLLFTLSPKPSRIAPAAARRLEVALRGIPSGEYRFESVVSRVLGRFPRVDGEGRAEANSLIHPTNWPAATIVTVDQADITFLVDNRTGAAKVWVLRDVEDSFPGFSASKAARIGSDLIVFGRIAGADYAAPAARSYHLSHGAWRETKSLTALPEEAWPGKAEKTEPEFQIDPKHPNTVRFVLELRDAPRNFQQCHLCPWLRYEERWLFADGRLRRVARQRISTPLAELDDLAGMVSRGNRSAFNTHVPKKLRRIVWGRLGAVLDDDAFLDPIAECPDSDELSDLSPKFKGRGWTVRLAKHHGQWRIANAVQS